MVVDLQQEEWNVVINIVAQQPYNQVAPLLQKMIGQLQPQVPQPPMGQGVPPQAAGNGQARQEG